MDIGIITGSGTFIALLWSCYALDTRFDVVHRIDTTLSASLLSVRRYARTSRLRAVLVPIFWITSLSAFCLVGASTLAIFVGVPSLIAEASERLLAN